ETVFQELRLRIDGDDVAHVDAEGQRFLAGAGDGIDAKLDMGPACRLGIDLLIERVAGSLERQDGAAEGALLGIDRRPRTFREAGRPMADRNNLQPAVFLYELHLRAECVEMRHDGARRLAPATATDHANGTATGELRLETKPP